MALFLKVMMIILHKKVPYCLLDILTHLCATKCFKKYQRLQFYGLYDPILDETPYIVTKCTVLGSKYHLTKYFDWLLKKLTLLSKVTLKSWAVVSLGWIFPKLVFNNLVLSRYIGFKPRHHFWDFSWFQPPCEEWGLVLD